MDEFSHKDVITILLQVGTILVFARIMGELARRLKQPTVIGEIMAGVILGPTVLGTIFPDVFGVLFDPHSDASFVLQGITKLSVVLLLFIAGLEVELSLVFQQGKRALITTFMSLIIPFSVGFLATYFMPNLFTYELKLEGGRHVAYALFLGTLFSMTALPVIARVLFDLEIFRTKMGMLIIASAMMLDIIGWQIFAVILSFMDTSQVGLSLWQTIALTIGFTIAMLTFLKGLINRSLPWVNNKLAWPGGLLSIAIGTCLFAAAFTEYIGIHAVFGAFILGIALGDSDYMRSDAKEIVHQFINNIFAPLFFVTIALYINFLETFNWKLVLFFTLFATVSKVLGGFLGAKWGGMRSFQALAVGFGMNTRGAIEIILATVALNIGLIDETIFVSLIVMVIIAIIVSPPIMKFCIEQHKKEKKLRKGKMKF